MDTIPVSPAFASSAWITAEKYDELYPQSINDPEKFWGEMGKTMIDWYKPFTQVLSGSFTDEDVRIEWFKGGKLNAAYNCIDRHLPERANQTAIIWLPENPEHEAIHITYQELYDNVCALTNVLDRLGVKKGDRVAIYLPMIPEALYAMLACARIGAIHSVVFSGLAADALRSRVVGCGAKAVITANEALHNGNLVPLKSNTDEALISCPDVKKVIVVKHTPNDVPMKEGRDIWLHEALVGTSTEFTPEEMDAEDPLFILYTSGSTGDPKGLVHTTGGYLVDAMLTFKWVFDYHDGDVFWSTADFGWITGHTYGPYGPLLNGATIVMLEGAPTYPSPSRIWNIVDEYKVTLLYTSPTALRTFRAEGDGYLKGTSRESLRVLGSVGEPIDPDLWEWYHRVVGGGRCPIVDTWWQTETGAHMITLLPGAMPQKPGVASKPFFGRAPVIIDKDTKELLSGACEGILCFQQPWPGMARDIWGNHARYLKTYFNEYPGYYFTGDGCRRDLDSYYKITGRVDDDFKVSAHRFSSEQIESACASHEAVVKSGVVGCPDERTGQGIYIFAVLKKGWEGDDALRQALANHIRIVIGKIAKAKEIQFVTGLPETRSGKTMRAILRKIVYGESIDVSEYPTLVNPSVVPSLIEGWKDLQLPRRKGIKVQGLPAKDQLKL